MSPHLAGWLFLVLAPLGLLGLVLARAHWLAVIALLVASGAALMALRCPRCRASIFQRPDPAGPGKASPRAGLASLRPPAKTCTACGLDLRTARLGEARPPGP